MNTEPVGYPQSALRSVPYLTGSSDWRQSQVDIAELIRGLWRRKWVIASITAVAVLLTAFVVTQMRPLYSATSTVMLDPRQNNVVNVEEVLGGLPPDEDTVNSEILVITSRALAAKVIRMLELSNLAEFNPNLPQPRTALDLINPASFLPWRQVAGALGFRSESRLPEEVALELELTAVVDSFLDRLSVERQGRSRAISITFRAENPELAARVANTLADQYLIEQLEAKFEATERATRWLNERVGELREQVQESERRVEDYRRQAGLVGGQGVLVESQQVSEINSQLIIARAQRAEAQARLAQVQRLINAGNLDSAGEVVQSNLIQRLREQESEVLRRQGELTQEFGPRHPRMQAIQSELADLRSNIEIEVRRIATSLQSELGVAQARESALDQSLRSIQTRAGELNQAEVQLRALEREADANRTLFETFLGRFKETAAQDQIQRPDARVLSMADIPQRPSSPRKGLAIAFALVLGLMIGIAIAFLLDQLDQGVRSGDQIESLTGLGVLGLVPLLPARARLSGPPENYVLEKPTSSYAEALRTIDTGLQLSDVDDPPRSVMITSSVPKEGKSTISISLGRLLARTGRRILLIDGDLRRPRVARTLGLSEEHGLVGVLSGQMPLEQAVQVDDKSGMHVLAAGGMVASPPELLGSDQMAQLIKRCEAEYDLVVIDSAPVLVVSDSRVLARQVDKCLFVVRWASTRRQIVVHGIKKLMESKVSVAGVVLSAVNVRRHAAYGYGDSGYYYGAARRYYGD